MPQGLIVDLFAGGGGASTGLEKALGRSPDIAIDHDPEALAMHAANHPTTRHLCTDILRVLPLDVTGGRPVDVLHASPDCKHFSRAKSGKPRSKGIRDLAWTVVRWAEDVRPALITLENVEEFQTWGPLDSTGHPLKSESGATFRLWVQRLRDLGYQVDWRELRACDFGVPTIRKRLFVVARRDGKPVVWPECTHGAPDSIGVRIGILQSWRTAADCIDWTLPSRSIFDRANPLALNTQRRIAEGIRRYVLAQAKLVLVELDHTLRGGNHSCTRLAASILKMRGTNVGSPMDFPLHTVSAQGQHHALIAAYLIKYYGCGVGSSMAAPLHTVTSKDRMGLVTASLGSADRVEQVQQFLRRWGIIDVNSCAEVPVNGENYRIVDISLRMLKPRELFRAQGFLDTHIIDPTVNGKRLSSTAQIRMCGNAVPPQFVAALVAANSSVTLAEPQPNVYLLPHQISQIVRESSYVHP